MGCRVKLKNTGHLVQTSMRIWSGLGIQSRYHVPNHLRVVKKSQNSFHWEQQLNF